MSIAHNEKQSTAAKRMYNARASIYDDSWHPAFARRMVGWANLQPGQHVLDLACGTGLVTIPVAQAVGAEGRIVAVDVSDGMLEQVRIKVRTEQLNNVEIIEHDITKIDEIESIKGRQFDAIIMASALVLLTDEGRIRARKLWAGLLKPGGVFVVDAATPDNQPEGLILERTGKRLGCPLPWNREWVKDEKSISDFLEDSGLRLEHIFSAEQKGEPIQWADEDDADKYFEKHIGGEHTKSLVAAASSDQARFTLADVRMVFNEEWRAKAVNGKVKIEDRVWVAVARKDRSPC